jgi:hypothetical protein
MFLLSISFKKLFVNINSQLSQSIVFIRKETCNGPAEKDQSVRSCSPTYNVTTPFAFLGFAILLL